MSHKLIILVEDDVNLRQSIAMILQRAGYCVSAIDNVSEALTLIRAGGYHLMICDANIPGTRKVLLPKALNVCPPLSIVIMTDQSSLEFEGDNRLLSAEYLVKPIAPEFLLESIKKLLGRHSITIQNKNENLLVNHNQDF